MGSRGELDTELEICFRNGLLQRANCRDIEHLMGLAGKQVSLPDKHLSRPPSLPDKYFFPPPGWGSMCTAASAAIRGAADVSRFPPPE